MHRALAAFTIALAVCLLATPLLRGVALRSGFVDRPSGRKAHQRSVPYLGGISLAVSTLLALLVVPGVRTQMAVLASAAVLLGVVGLVDDERSLGVVSRVAAQLAVASIAVALGVRAHPTGIEAYDVVLSLVWIVGITNAFNLLDNMDGLAAGVAASTAAGIVALAAFGNRPGDAAVAAALVGACLGFLVHNWRPATIFMGDAGALFLGFVLAVGALEVQPAIGAPQSLLVPLSLLAVPLLDTVTVVLARVRRGIPVSRGGRDHLSHRLVALGLGRAAAVAWLVGVQAAFALLAVAVGRDALDARAAALCWGLGLGLLAAVTSRARVYAEEVAGLPRALVVVPAVVVLASALCAVPAALAASRAREPLDRARDAVLVGVDLLEDGDGAAAGVAFAQAAGAFAEAQRRLDGSLTDVGLAVPGVATNLRAARDAVHAGLLLSRGGARLADAMGSSDLRIGGGAVPIHELDRVAPALQDARALLAETLADVRDIDRTLVVPPLTTRLAALQSRLVRAEHDAANTARAVELGGRVFGGEGTRRYLLTVQDVAEQRATSGVVRGVGVLVAAAGTLHLERFEPVSALPAPAGPAPETSDDFTRRYERFEATERWPNVNLTPDVPTAARVASELFARTGGVEVDGVVSLDVRGLAALLELTGPVRVPSVEGVVDAGNVRRLTAPGDGSVLVDVAREVWEAVSERDLGTPPAIARALGPVAERGHLQVWMVDRDEQALARDLEVSGHVPATTGDSLLVVTQNASGARTDAGLARDVAYDVTVAPDDDLRAAQVESSVTITLRNTGRVALRTYVSVYSPFAFTRATLGGEPTHLESAEELGRRVASTFVRVPAEDVRVLRVELAGEVALDDGCYRLDLLRQPALAPGALDLALSGRGATLAAERAAGVIRTAGGRYTGPLAGPAHLAVRFAPTGPRGWLDGLAKASAAPCR